MRFKNKVVVVTGASRGIGQSIAIAFVRAGAKVAGVARSDLTATASQVKAAGGEFVAANADLGKFTQKQAADLVARIVKQTGRIDVLVNNAGIIRRAPAVDYSEADWNEVLQTNLSAPFFLCQAVAKWWLTAGRDKSPADARLKIVNIASVLSFQGGITVPAYTASKHGVAGFTKALANEWAKERITSTPLHRVTSPRRTPSRCATMSNGTRPFLNAYPRAAGADRRTLRAAAFSWRRRRPII